MSYSPTLGRWVQTDTGALHRRDEPVSSVQERAGKLRGSARDGFVGLGWDQSLITSCSRRWEESPPQFPRTTLGSELIDIMALADLWNANQGNYVPWFNDCEEQTIALTKYLESLPLDYWEFTPIEVWDGALLFHNAVVVTPKPLSGNTYPPVVLDPFHGPLADLLGDRDVQCYTLGDLAKDYPYYTKNHSYSPPPGTTPPSTAPTPTPLPAPPSDYAPMPRPHPW